MTTALPPLTPLADEAGAFDDLDPAPRLLMGPGPINADPRVLRAMAAPLLGQFDPQFRRLMKETMALYRRVFETRNDWTFVVDGTARSAIEMAIVSIVERGDRVLVASFGRFGQLQTEIARRCGGDVRVIEAEWGTVFADPVVATAILDRLLHHSHVLTIRGDSYRLRAKRKSGLIKPPIADDGPPVGSASLRPATGGASHQPRS